VIIDAPARGVVGDEQIVFETLCFHPLPQRIDIVDFPTQVIEPRCLP
jgi:hypothetical protein